MTLHEAKTIRLGCILVVGANPFEWIIISLPNTISVVT